MATSSPNQHPEDTLARRSGADTSSVDKNRTPLSNFSDSALTTSSDSFSKEKARAKGSVDLKGLGLHNFQIAENTATLPAPAVLENPWAGKNITGQHVEARTSNKPEGEIPNPFAKSVLFGTTRPAESASLMPAPVEVTKPQVAPPLEHPRVDMEHPFASPAKTFELNRLRNGSGQTQYPDAVVRLPENFDPTKPIHLVVYNHGFGDSASTAYRNADLNKQMRDAAPNTVLIVPEWQSMPKNRTSADGHFGEKDRFKNLVNEAFSRTPGLDGQSLKNVDSIHLIGHSAGYKGVEKELYNNGLEDKVTKITMLDSLYNPTDLDPWLHSNIRALSNGTKQFTNISNFGHKNTFAASQDQANRIKQWLREAHLPISNVFEDYNNSSSVLSAETLQQHPIAFKLSDANVPGKGHHMSLPDLYVKRVVVQAADS